MRKIVFDFSGIKQNELPIQDNTIKRDETKKDSANEMFDYINTIMENENYGIGLHSIRLHSAQEEKIDTIANHIMENGLEIEEKKKILSTVSSFGTHTNIKQDHLKQQMLQYSYGKQDQVDQNVIILVPSIVSNSQGKQIYLGFPPFDTECHGNDYRTSSVLDTICTNQDGKGKIPSEFILGYYSNNNGNFNFIKNPNYIKFLSEEQKDAFFKNIEGRLKGKYRIISDAVTSGDITTLEKLSEEEQSEIETKIKEGIRNNILERGCNMQLAETLSRNSVQIKQDDSATQALSYVERKKDKEIPPQMSSGNKKRMILLEAYNGYRITTSDLSHGKGLLREPIIENDNKEKNNRGEEI